MRLGREMYGSDGSPDIDLGDYSLGGGYDTEDDWRKPYVEPVAYQYKFKDYEALITSDVFQDALLMALRHKDKVIDSLRKELMQQPD